MGLQGYTRVYMGLQGHARVYKGLHGCTRVIQGFTWDYWGSHRNIGV